MRTRAPGGRGSSLFHHMVICAGMAVCLHVPAFSGAVAQEDSGGVFKLLPKYDPRGEEDDIPPPPLPADTPTPVWTPEIRFPDDPALTGRSARVWVKAHVDAQGRVSDARILVSSDTLFDAHALALAREYRFVWPRGMPPRDSVWVALPFHFNP